MLMKYSASSEKSMLDRYKVKLTPVAVDDLDSIFNYIFNELHATTAAHHIINNIETEIFHLAKFPYFCEAVRDEVLNRKGYRKLLIDNYIVFYIVNEELKIVQVMRIIFGKRDYCKLL